MQTGAGPLDRGCGATRERPAGISKSETPNPGFADQSGKSPVNSYGRPSEDYWPVGYRPVSTVTYTILSGAVTAPVFPVVYGFGQS